MIQIDDAGSGSLIGGTCIGILRIESNQFYYDIIPIKLFNEQNFNKKSYIYYTTQIIKNALDFLNVSKKEQIYICQGYVFENTREYLKEQNYNFVSCKIEDPLQSLIERTFEEYVISLGVPSDFLIYTKYPFHFHRLLKWVYADYNNRIKYCKTGWKSWKKYGCLKTKKYQDKIIKSNYVCLKCGKKIDDNSIVRVIKFTSNMDYYVFLHKNC